MNKRIKKKHKKGSLSAFNKSDKLFIKKYPRLYVICNALKIDKQIINRLYKYCNRYKYITKRDFELNIAIILRRYDYSKNLEFKIGSIGYFNLKYFTDLGVTFLDNEGNFKIKRSINNMEWFNKLIYER